jgi:3-oxoacyl-[acyl-carrier protein] reductase
LGKAVALRLAQEEAHVTICARGQEDLTSAAAEIRKATGQRVLAIPADITDPEAAPALVDATLEEFGRLDILITNAGGPPPGKFLDFTAQDWGRAAQLTLMSAVRLCYAAAPVMMEQGKGSILAVTSITVKQPLTNLVLSNSLRLGVTGLVKTLADELAPFGIRVNALCPGWKRASISCWRTGLDETTRRPRRRQRESPRTSLWGEWEHRRSLPLQRPFSCQRLRRSSTV